MPDRVSRGRARGPQTSSKPTAGRQSPGRRERVSARPSTRHQPSDNGFHPGIYLAIVLGISFIGVCVYFGLTNRTLKNWVKNLGQPQATVQMSAAPTDSTLLEATESATATPTAEATPTPTPTVEPTPTPVTDLTISAVGDIMAHEPELTAAYDKSSKKYDFEPFFESVKEELSAADLTIGNLETTISTNGKYSGYPRFSSPASLLTALKNVGFDVITTSNNHSYDKGYAGVVKTIEALEETGLAHTGTFRSKEEYNAPLIVEANGMKVAVLAYTYGVNSKSGVSASEDRYAIKQINLDTIEKDIKASREGGADVVIVSVHWGTEYDRSPNDDAEQQAEAMLKMGADLVLGSHPHVMQPIRRVSVTRDDGTKYEGIVAFSMGNFISNQTGDYKDSGMIFNATLHKDPDTGAVTIAEASYVPTWVYIGGNAGYEVLPVGKVLDDDSLLSELSSSARKRIKEVWKQTTELVGTDAATAVR